MLTSRKAALLVLRHMEKEYAFPNGSESWVIGCTIPLAQSTDIIYFISLYNESCMIGTSIAHFTRSLWNGCSVSISSGSHLTIAKDNCSVDLSAMSQVFLEHVIHDDSVPKRGFDEEYYWALYSRSAESTFIKSYAIRRSRIMTDICARVAEQIHCLCHGYSGSTDMNRCQEPF